MAKLIGKKEKCVFRNNRSYVNIGSFRCFVLSQIKQESRSGQFLSSGRTFFPLLTSSTFFPRHFFLPLEDGSLSSRGSRPRRKIWNFRREWPVGVQTLNLFIPQQTRHLPGTMADEKENEQATYFGNPKRIKEQPTGEKNFPCSFESSTNVKQYFRSSESCLTQENRVQLLQKLDYGRKAR